MNVLQAVARTRALQSQRRTFIQASALRSPQGYGEGKGDPAVPENTEKQPATTKAQEDSEHPGPSAPDVGKGTANASTKRSFSENMEKAASSGESKEEQASAQSGGSRSKEAVETGESPTGGQIPNNDKGAKTGTAYGGEALKGTEGKNAPPRPKILNQSASGVESDLTKEQKEEVDQHNREFDEKHDKSEPAPQDKVDKKFWSGV